MRQRDATKTSTDNQHAGNEEHTVSRPPQSSFAVSGGFAPTVRGQQTACGGCGKDVMIHLEAGNAEESNDDDRPEPQQPFAGFERLISAEPLEGVDCPAGDNDAPRKECPSEGTDVEGVIDSTRGELDWLHDVPQVAGEEVSFDELVAESPLHPDEPRGGGKRDG